MPYFAKTEEQACNGLMFFRNEIHNPEKYLVKYINGEFVMIPRFESGKP